MDFPSVAHKQMFVTYSIFILCPQCHLISSRNSNQGQTVSQTAFEMEMFKCQCEIVIKMSLICKLLDPQTTSEKCWPVHVLEALMFHPTIKELTSTTALCCNNSPRVHEKGVCSDCGHG